MKLNNKKGISLIVLVITIIVMIVLAAAIILSLSSSGVIGRANEAKSKSDTTNAKQVVVMAEAEWKLDEENIRAEYGVNTFKDYANIKLNDAGFTTEGNGGISLSGSGAINTIYVDKNNKQVIVPEGFVVSRLDGEQTVSTGLVIKDENGNEFVWVPVEVPTGKTFEEVFVSAAGSWSGEVEPYSTDTYTSEITEYKEMYESVKENKGFYIGRYETGTTVERKSDYSNETSEVVVQKNKPVYNYVGWGKDMTGIPGEVITNDNYNQGYGAITLSREMYKDSNSVVSTLCYGIQWDAAVKFIVKATGYHAFNRGQLIKEAKAQPTGYSAVKNIYDMAGNVQEWTMSASGNEQRMARGQGFRGESSAQDVSYGIALNATGCWADTGFRIALYLK